MTKPLLKVSINVENKYRKKYCKKNVIFSDYNSIPIEKIVLCRMRNPI
jgi:hypothetical protein